MRSRSGGSEASRAGPPGLKRSRRSAAKRSRDGQYKRAGGARSSGSPTSRHDRIGADDQGRDVSCPPPCAAARGLAAYDDRNHRRAHDATTEISHRPRMQVQPNRFISIPEYG